MKANRNHLVGGLTLVLLTFLWMSAPAWAAADEESFPLLQVGTRTYTNVTVTTKAKKYVFIFHSTGMANFKVADLSPELRSKLGYDAADEKAAKPSGATLAAWTKQKMSLLSVPQVRAAEKQLEETWRARAGTDLSNLKSADPKLLLSVLGGVLIFYLFSCYCSKLICEKTGNKPGALIWLPLLQVLPMLRAASMSPLWILAFPLAPFVWCFKIAKARGKSAWVGVLLLLPVFSLFAFLYLAFSTGKGAEPKERRVVEVMCLETA